MLSGLVLWILLDVGRYVPGWRPERGGPCRWQELLAMAGTVCCSLALLLGLRSPPISLHPAVTLFPLPVLFLDGTYNLFLLAHRPQIRIEKGSIECHHSCSFPGHSRNKLWSLCRENCWGLGEYSYPKTPHSRSAEGTL